MLLAFDEEVSSEEREHLQSDLHALRYPEKIEHCFAISAAFNNRFFPPNTKNAAKRTMSESSNASVGASSR